MEGLQFISRNCYSMNAYSVLEALNPKLEGRYSMWGSLLVPESPVWWPHLLLEVPPGKRWSLNFFFFFFVLGPYLQHMGVLRLGVESGLQLLAYTTATAMQDLSHICDLQCSLLQCWILNPLRETRDWTLILTETSQVLFVCVTSHMEVPRLGV